MAPVDIFSSPAVRVLLALEQEGVDVRVVNGRLRVSPSDRLTTGQEAEIRGWRDDLIVLVQICDEGVHARRALLRRQLDAAGPPSIPSFLVCPNVPWERGTCFGCGDPNASGRDGRCWRCSLAWRLVGRVSISGDLGAGSGTARVCA